MEQDAKQKPAPTVIALGDHSTPADLGRAVRTLINSLGQALTGLAGRDEVSVEQARDYLSHFVASLADGMSKALALLPKEARQPVVDIMLRDAERADKATEVVTELLTRLIAGSLDTGVAGDQSKPTLN
jgi:hypothetical protein